jgi:secreted trypsin-like serine protease
MTSITMAWRRVVLPSALALPACGGSGADLLDAGDPPAEIGRVEQTILGGAVDDGHPEVMLLADAAGFLCTGTTILAEGGTGFLLTAAHCVTENAGRAGVVPLAPARLIVVPGTDFAESLDAFPVEAVTVEPSYRGGFAEDDIAIVRYFFGNSPAPGTIEPLGAEADALELDDEVTLVGYGQTELVALNTERRSVERSVDGLDTELVAYSQEDGNGACFGDSGGPGLVVVGGEERVGLVISGGVAGARGDCASGIGLAMRVSAYEGFIESVLSGAGD